jgi:hypothetical protein
LQSFATEILFGGAAGAGKSWFMRAVAIILCGLIPGLNVYLFRRIYDDLIKNHMEGTGGFPVMLAPLILSGHVKIVAEEIRFWNGSRIFLCHCEHEKHRFKYQGAEIHVLLIDELTMFTEVIYRFLRGRMRAPAWKSRSGPSTSSARSSASNCSQDPAGPVRLEPGQHRPPVGQGDLHRRRGAVRGAAHVQVRGRHAAPVHPRQAGGQPAH